MIVTAYDFETTGVNARECEPCQVAAIDVQFDEHGDFVEIHEVNYLLQIDADEIPEGASNVHGIFKKDTLNGLIAKDVIGGLSGTVLGYNNNSYDNTIAKRYGAQITDSLDLFKFGMWARAEKLSPSAKLSDVYEAMTGLPAENAHDALADVRMTLALIAPAMRALNFTLFSEFVTWLQHVEVNPHMAMPFGKHKGVKLSEMPKAYLEWLHKKADLTGALKASVAAARSL